jgi:hypothetical protein
VRRLELERITGPIAADDESAPAIECESWIEIHSPGKNVPDGVNVSV